jgi:hypothetical protein
VRASGKTLKCLKDHCKGIHFVKENAPEDFGFQYPLEASPRISTGPQDAKSNDKT